MKSAQTNGQEKENDMKRKIKMSAAIVMALLMVLSTAMVALGATQLGDNYLECYGDFEGMIPEGETEYAYNNDNFSANAGGTLSGGINTLKKDGDNTYLEIKGDHVDAFGDIWMRFNLDDGNGDVKLAEAGTYTVSFRYYKVAGWQATANAGMRIWQNNAAYDIQFESELNAAPEGQWNTMTFDVEVAEAGVVIADSIHFWLINTPGSTLYVDDLEVRLQTIVEDETVDPEQPSAPDTGDIGGHYFATALFCVAVATAVIVLRKKNAVRG